MVGITYLQPHLDLPNAQDNGPYTAYVLYLYFEILGHYFGHFGGPLASAKLLEFGLLPGPPTICKTIAHAEPLNPGASNSPK